MRISLRLTHRLQVGIAILDRHDKWLLIKWLLTLRFPLGVQCIQTPVFSRYRSSEIIPIPSTDINA